MKDELPIPHPYWIETLHGQAFDLQRPDPKSFNIVEIAHALSMKCRFGGHIPTHYSVAQHCVHVAELVPITYTRAALLHDVEEAYGPDFLSPYKRLIKQSTEILSFYARLVREAAGVAFDVSLVPTHECVVRADLQMLVAERRDLKPGVPLPQPWGPHLPTLAEVGHIRRVEPWTAEVARARFLDIFDMTGQG